MKLHKAHKCDRELTQLVCEKTIESGSLNAQMVEWSKAALWESVVSCVRISLWALIFCDYNKEYLQQFYFSIKLLI